MSKAKGSRAEHRTIRVLEAAGYTCQRAAGSLGAFDVLAWLPGGPVRFIQVKCGIRPYCAPAEREAMQLTPLPAGATRELWLWRDYARQPRVELL